MAALSMADDYLPSAETFARPDDETTSFIRQPLHAGVFSAAGMSGLGHATVFPPVIIPVCEF
jgi:hypothetical protein